MSFENRRKICMAHVISTTRGGKVWSMDWWFFEKAQLQTTIYKEKYVIKYSPKWMGAIYFSTAICGSELQGSKWSRDFYNTWLTAKNLKSKIRN
jgi:hypothetical protein